MAEHWLVIPIYCGTYRKISDKHQSVSSIDLAPVYQTRYYQAVESNRREALRGTSTYSMCFFYGMASVSKLRDDSNRGSLPDTRSRIFLFAYGRRFDEKLYTETYPCIPCITTSATMST